jgi:hypothetical protein
MHRRSGVPLATKGYEGAVKSLARPFAPGRHEAFTARDVFMARFDRRGHLMRAR